MSIDDIPKSLLDAVESVIKKNDSFSAIAGLRKDIDAKYLYLFAGLDKHNRLNEVYASSINEFPEMVDDELRVHNALAIHSPIDNYDVKKSLDFYMGNGSKEINHHLWEHHKDQTHQIPLHIKNHINNIESILKPKTELENAKLYTGVPISPATTAGIEWNSSRPVKFLKFPAFTSASSNFKSAAKFTNIDRTSLHHESDHHGIIKPNARHVIELNFNGHIRNAVSLYGHGNDFDEREILLGRDHEFELHTRPKLIDDYYDQPVYVWKATPGLLRPSPKKV